MRKSLLALAVLGLAVAGIILVVARGASAALTEIGPCPVFPANNVWNVPVDNLPVDSLSASYINSMGPTTPLHPDFGTVWDGAPIGIPYTVVSANQPLVNVFTSPNGYPGESDLGMFPIPRDAPIEGGPNSDGDRHVLVVNQGDCKLYELYRAFPQADGSWMVDSSAKYDLLSNALRPDTWTSADAAGLPIFSGLVRYDEVQAGEIKHAIRFTAQITQKKHIWPARHDASDVTDPRYPPMGQRFRLKSTFNISTFSPSVQVILRAMQRYGVILADNGSNWYIGGAPDSRWNDDDLVTSFRKIHGSDFEAVDESSLMRNPDSGQAGPDPMVNQLFLPWLRK